ncbi:histidine kinase [Streptomyces sp. NPDC049906]|uniref:sensor histidine kinase n=1 Tax=Streptomyces sp. NPDC049906 TaxID=3155656 RepID=UPI00341702BD
MRRPGAWWRGKSTTAKVESYTRGTFHSFSAIEVGVLAPGMLNVLDRATALLALALLLTHAGIGSFAGARALDWVCGRRARPLGTVAVMAAATVLIAVALLLVTTRGLDPGSPSAAEEKQVAASATAYLIVFVFGTGALTLGLRGARQIVRAVCGLGACAGIGAFVAGVPLLPAAITTVTVTLGSGFMALAAALSVWLLTVVIELDAARETRARLAVAEERLRFGRDLHDVLGRNLAVIALKSELAVQLAHRQRPEAVTQMVEVQRIAQESQREVREVVRGYREADLSVELSGAQGVLTAAGIDCRLTGSAAGLPARVQAVLGWVVRETTTNVLRHGAAEHCTVALVRTPTAVTLTVENDGMTDTSAAPTDGTGLAGLRERLADLDGTLDAGPVGAADRVGGRTFRVTARVPLALDDPNPDAVPTKEVAE